MRPVQKVSDFIFPGKISDSRLANLITVVDLHAHVRFVAASPGASFSPRQLVCEVL
jgi:hypothetical protein